MQDFAQEGSGEIMTWRVEEFLGRVSRLVEAATVPTNLTGRSLFVKYQH
jgi:hypothetical protein